MKKVVLLASSLALAGLSSSALANGIYLGAAYNNQKLSPQETNAGSFSVKTVDLVAGYQVNQYFSVEASVVVSSNDDLFEAKDASYFTQEYVDIDSQWSLKAKGTYPISDAFSVFAYASYLDTEIKGEFVEFRLDENGATTGISARGSFAFSDSGVGFGLGAQYNFNENWAVYADYSLHPDFEIKVGESSTKIDHDSFSFGVTYKF